MSDQKGQLPGRRDVILGSVAATALVACDARPTNTLRSSDTHPKGYPTVSAVEEVGRLIHERTDGRLSLKVFSGGQLGSERDALEMVTFGALDFSRVNLAPLNSIEPLTVVPALPFLFRSQEHMRRSLDGEPGRRMLASLEPHGIIGLGFYDSGERSFYNTRGPIQSPDDMKGMKIRVPSSDLYVSMIRALGADATPMYLGEVYQALVQGVIDGAENNWPSYESGRHYEAASFYSLTKHVMAPEVLVMSKVRWDAMSSNDRDLVKQAVSESVPFMRNLWDDRVGKAKEKLLASGVNVNELSDIEPFVDAMRPVWDRFVVSPEQRSLVEAIERMVP